jgi:exonuclease III
MKFFRNVLLLASGYTSNALRVMQYNVEWLFIDYYKSADCPGNGCPWHDEPTAYEHLQRVADVINEVNPDVINMCEVEGINELNKLQDLLNTSSNSYNSYLIKGTDTSTGQNVGMISNILPLSELSRTENRADYPVSFSSCGYTGNDSGTEGVSKHFTTLFNWGSMKVAYISLHFLAYPDKVDRCIKREGQAMVIQDLVIDYVKSGYEIMIIGDINDYDNDVKDKNDNKPISQVLNILKGVYSNGIYELTNLNSFVDKENRYSNWWDKNNDCSSSSDELVEIDHILVSNNLLNVVKNVSIYHTYNEYCGTLNSDHYPIIVDFDITI